MRARALVLPATAAALLAAPLQASPDGSRAPLALDLSGLNGASGSARSAPWEAMPVVPAATAVRGSTYVARATDTVRGVGEATGVGGNAIIRANALSAPYTLHAGQTLIVPAGRYHRVREGETGIAIARAYGVTWGRIIDANALAEPFALRVGQRLVLPDPILQSRRDDRHDDRSIERRAAAFQIGIDDIMTGGEAARAGSWAPVAPAPAVTTAAPRTFLWPADGRVITPFGSQGRGRVNQGVDLAATSGTSIRAAARGEVAYVGNGVPGFGWLILVRHDGGWISAYGRIASAAVTKGARVAAGQAIGRVGSDSLHFELRRARVAVDPVRYLPVQR